MAEDMEMTKDMERYQNGMLFRMLQVKQQILTTKGILTLEWYCPTIQVRKIFRR